MVTLAVAVALVSWRGPVVAVAVVPVALAASAFLDWGRSDETGLFVVGVGMVLVGSTAAVAVVGTGVHLFAGGRGGHGLVGSRRSPA